MNKIAGVVYIVIGNIFWGNYQTVLQNVTLAIRSIKELEEKGVSIQVMKRKKTTY